MFRCLATTLLVCAFLPAVGAAANWANEMFVERQHDFGKVARGDKPAYDFLLTNTTSKEVRIRAIRVSCSCTKAVAAAGRIPPGSSTLLTATMDTSGFQGSKSVAIYVQFDRPWRAEVMLRVNCESVGKLGAEATEVDFGILPQGSAPTKKLNLDYAGPLDWQVTDLDYGNPHFLVEVMEASREPGKVRYELTISLQPNCGAGLHEDEIRIHTNDAATPLVLVKAKAQIEADIVVTPSSIRLTGLAPGQVAQRKIILKAAQPFKVLRVDNADGVFDVETSPDAKTVQLVTLTFTNSAGGEIPEHIDIVTDLGGQRVVSVDVVR